LFAQRKPDCRHQFTVIAQVRESTGHVEEMAATDLPVRIGDPVYIPARCVANILKEFKTAFKPVEQRLKAEEDDGGQHPARDFARRAR
jgi:hypothetical protein